ncbi:6-phosphofructokinase [Herbivorax sp. ANBcel31]|uniref:6-phosphofructokinase n=1 Tax=Herbivorax sp. ANBcel31 TaxID=3069754 RepID=UPI0027B877FE|nr:6-phosphofructokinase [Herbivorax sp. ANBcel31]MDQ2087649.1 6-phosphofructokinase [Herbivorax sp. ANBcel31]
MNNIKTMGVLTSGGDAPGMNAAIRSVVRAGLYYGFKVFGIRKGYEGLIRGDVHQMNARTVGDILHRGGTILQTARSPQFKTEQGQKKAISMANVFGIDAIVVIGGDGSYRGARALSELGINVIGIPGTIDNDIASTDYTIGFDTALNTVQDALDKIRDTAYSHERCSILEVMGRHAGYIALNVGISGGAESVILPEMANSLDMDRDVIKPIIEARNRGKKHYIVIVAEGVQGKAMEIEKEVMEKTGIDARATILGHIQRGGSPTVHDRVTASVMGVRAVEVLKNNGKNRIISLKDGVVTDIDINEALEMKKTLPEDMIKISKILSL